jgi:hypothetical protein
MSEQKVRVTGADIQAAGEKLDAFTSSLPENERAVIGWLMQRAEAAPPDVEEEVSGYLGAIRGESSIGPPVAGPTSHIFNSLGVSQLGLLRPGQINAVSVTVGVMF